MTGDVDGVQRARTHILAELGMSAQLVGEELRGRVEVVPEMYAPGTSALRTSILAAYADLLTGILTSRLVAPRVPVTLDLSVQLLRPPISCSEVSGAARVVKAGRSAIVAEVDFTADGSPLAMAIGSFMASPDPALRLPPFDETLTRHQSARGRLAVPYAERAGCLRAAPGVATLPRTTDGLNASNTINGGLIALAVEEAALPALAPSAGWIGSLDLRYLRPARVGPLVARAECWDALARVEVRDSGQDDRLVVLATARLANSVLLNHVDDSCAE